MKKTNLRVFVSLILGLTAIVAWGQSFIDHTPTGTVYNELSSVTQRNPAIPREDDVVQLWCRVGYQFQYTNVALYYTTDGSNPAGFHGTPSGTSQVLTSAGGGITFKYNQPTGSGTVDWWVSTLPSTTRSYQGLIRYVFEAWGSSNTVVSSAYSYTNKLAWPGGGSGSSHVSSGYPDQWMWKEEAVTGNNWINVMLDQNGSIYDVYYPGAGTVNGVAAKNEGYKDGIDTFPSYLSAGQRGQLNFNMACVGLRTGGTTYWMTNQSGGDYVNNSQRYVTDSQTVYTTSTLVGGGNNIKVEQFDFTPKLTPTDYPRDGGNGPLRGIYVKRMILTNNGPTSKDLNVYFYMDPAINGGDGYDQMYFDTGAGAMVAYDNTARNANASGEYNPSTNSDYGKNVSLFFAAAMKATSVGGDVGTVATDNWRDTSSDNGQGWIGMKITIPAGGQKEVTATICGGYDTFAGATGTYAYQNAHSLGWVMNQNMSYYQSQTDQYWSNWLTGGTVMTTPDSSINSLYKRALLATCLHCDEKTGSVVAGMHNGAYMYCWPRDAVWAAVTLDRTGHWYEADNVYYFLRNVAYRGNESWGKGFFYQKYSADGYYVWAGPQVDETAVVPWGVKYHYDCTGTLGTLQLNYNMVHDSAYASSSSSALDGRIYYDSANSLMHSMNVWEDSFDDFIFSNANCVKALNDASWIANKLGYPADSTLFSARSSAILNGINGRLDWNGENTDISQLGCVYPFRIYSPTDPRMKKLIDRMNGTATDRNGNNHPIIRTSGEWNGLVDRYYGDTYWNGGPWTLSTLWYGMYYLWRSDYTQGKADIDVHKSKLDSIRAKLGPNGLGSEQIAPSNSLLYSGQSDFALQAAWPNAWESMSFYADSLMAFLDWTPDSDTNTLRISPKLPSSWPSCSWSNLKMGSNQFNVTVSESNSRLVQVITNVTGNSANLGTWVRLPANTIPARVLRNGVGVPYSYDSVANRVNVQCALATGSNAQTVITVLPGTKTAHVSRNPDAAGYAP